MAEAAKKEADLSVAECIRQIKAECTSIESIAVYRYERIGALLLQIKQQLPKGRFTHRFIRENFPFSPESARRYMRFYTQSRSRQRAPHRLSDVDPPRRDHQSASFRAYQEEVHKARQYRAENPEPPPNTARATHSDSAYVRELCMRIISIGFRTLALELHPDKGGTDRDMNCLTRARDQLRGCVK